MNPERRHKVSDINSTITDLQTALDTLMEEEQEAYDCLPVPLQETAKGDDMMAAIDILDSASAGLEEVLDHLEAIP